MDSMVDGAMRIECAEEWRRQKQYAYSNPKAWRSWKRCEDFLRIPQFFGTPSYTKVYGDFAPRSFGFSIYREEDDEFIMNGGMIYYGPADGSGADAPQFSVRIGEHKEEWSIHT